MHVGRPIHKDAAQRFGPDSVAVHHGREQASGQMARIGPAGELEDFRLFGALAMELGSGLPPSAQTRRSIMAFKGFADLDFGHGLPSDARREGAHLMKFNFTGLNGGSPVAVPCRRSARPPQAISSTSPRPAGKWAPAIELRNML
jgi:hypothetical protein